MPLGYLALGALELCGRTVLVLAISLVRGDHLDVDTNRLLHLASNQLSGPFPEGLTTLTRLGYVQT